MPKANYHRKFRQQFLAESEVKPVDLAINEVAFKLLGQGVPQERLLVAMARLAAERTEPGK